jgi:hypothetical protein
MTIYNTKLLLNITKYIKFSLAPLYIGAKL